MRWWHGTTKAASACTASSMFVLGETFGTEDPRTGEIYTQVAEAQEADVDAAVKAARMVNTHSVVCLKIIVHLLHSLSKFHSAFLAQSVPTS